MPKTSVEAGTTQACELCQTETFSGIFKKDIKDIESILKRIPELKGSDYQSRQRDFINNKRNQNLNELKGRLDVSRTDIAKAVLKPEVEELISNYISLDGLKFNISEPTLLNNLTPAGPTNKNNLRFLIGKRLSFRYALQGQDPQDSSLSLEAKKCVIFCTGSEIVGKWKKPLTQKTSIEAIFNKNIDGLKAGIYYSGKL